MAEGLGQLAIIKSHTDLKLCVSFFMLTANRRFSITNKQ